MRARGLPWPAGSGLLDTVCRDLGGLGRLGCLEERGGMLVAGLLLRLHLGPRASREPRVARRFWVAAALETGRWTWRSCAGRASGADVIVQLRLDSTLRGIHATL